MPWWNWATLATVPSHLLLSSVFRLVPLKREKHLAYGRTPSISKAMPSLRQSGSAFSRLGFLRRTNRKEAEPINKVSGEPEQNEFYNPGLSVPSPVFSTGSGSLAAGMHKSTHVPLFQTPPTTHSPFLLHCLTCSLALGLFSKMSFVHSPMVLWVSGPTSEGDLCGIRPSPFLNILS